jgi:hypothetical protein
MKAVSSRREFIKGTMGGASLVSLGLPSKLSGAQASLASGASQPTEPKIKPAVTLFPLGGVRLLEGPFKDHQELDRAYLHRIEPDRLLSWCRREAGLEPKAPPYQGWESGASLLPGHILGFYLSSASMMCESAHDELLRQRIAYAVDGLAEVQRANGSGYFLPTINGKRLFQEVARGHIEIGGDPYTYYQINGVFEPTYVLNKIMLGLYAAHSVAQVPQARDVLIRAADWFGHAILDKLSEEQTQHLLDCEHGSLNESFVDVYTMTGDPKYLVWGRRLCHRVMLDPLSEGKDILNLYHANTQIPKFTGFQRVYTFTGEQKLTDAANFFWSTVVANRSWVNGGNSADEHFFDPAKSEEALLMLQGPESCNSVNMLRLTEALYQARGETAKIDYYERTLYNHILAAHDPERGMFVYFTPMRPGHYRAYSDEFDSMWCCVGTGMESPAKYGRMIYARDAGTVYVNLFIPSELNDPEKGLNLTQTTRFPHEEFSKLKLECREPVEFSLAIRHPRWLNSEKIRIRVNGQEQHLTSTPGTYASITRQWRSGDIVEVQLPMRSTVETLPHNERYAAFLYGPIVLAGRMGREGLCKEDFWATNEEYGRLTLPEEKVPVLLGDPAELVNRLQRIPGDRLSFRTVDASGPREMNLAPLSDVHFERYVVYWQTMDAEEWAKENARRQEITRRAAELDNKSVDAVLIGDAVSERSHYMKHRGSALANGPAPTCRTCRQVADGAFFSYELKVASDSPIALYYEYISAANGPTPFEVRVDDSLLITTDKIVSKEAESFRGAVRELPTEVIRGKQTVRVKVQAPAGGGAAKLLALRMIRI